MKKTFRFMAVLATVAAALASCAKAEMDAPADGNADGGNIYQGPVKTLTFTAQTGTPQTRTSLGDVVTDGQGNKTQPVLWDADDEIKILFMVDGTEYSVTAKPTSVDGSSAVFEAEVPESGVENFYAVYPSTASSTLTMKDGESGEMRVTIKDGEQDDEVNKGLFKDANIMVAKCAASSPELNFKHACSIIKFTTGDKAPGNVFFYSGNRKFNRGYSYVNFDDSNDISEITTAAQSNKYSKVNASQANTEYYMALWPDHTLQDGFIIAFRSSGFINTKDGWRVAYHTEDVTLERGEILDLGVIQDKIRTDYFVASEAKGRKDGSSWDNACDIAYVRNMFAKPADADYAYAQQMKLENTSFWFAGDATFVFGTDETPRMDMCFAGASKGNRCPINFYGGCTGTTGTDKTRDPKGHPTVFSGNDQYALFSVRNKTTLTLDGITLANTDAAKANAKDKLYGGALYVSFISMADGIFAYNLEFDTYGPEVHVNNCVFSNNNQSGAAAINANVDSGTAINLDCGEVYVNSCIFDSNVGCTRGVIRASNNSVGGSVFLNDSYFTGNYNSLSSSSYGTIVWCVDADVKFCMNNCTFKDNVAPGKTKTGRGHLTINSPYVIVNSTIVESTDTDASHEGLLRVAVSGSYNNSEAVHANNIIINTSGSNKNAIYYANANDTYTLKSYGYNLTSAIRYPSDHGYKITTSEYDRTGVATADFAEWGWSQDNNCYIWTGCSPEGSLKDFSDRATAEQMIAATKANSKIGDDFYNWLVEIGAIVDGRFTDCRGYLRPAEAMCPGAYDPNATQPSL